MPLCPYFAIRVIECVLGCPKNQSNFRNPGHIEEDQRPKSVTFYIWPFGEWQLLI